jgi:hypothetical protein
LNRETKERLSAQQELINELGAPVIPIVDAIAVLPLIGEIDTYRAKEWDSKQLHWQKYHTLIHRFIGSLPFGYDGCPTDLSIDKYPEPVRHSINHFRDSS